MRHLIRCFVICILIMFYCISGCVDQKNEDVHSTKTFLSESFEFEMEMEVYYQVFDGIAGLNLRRCLFRFPTVVADSIQYGQGVDIIANLSGRVLVPNKLYSADSKQLGNNQYIISGSYESIDNDDILIGLKIITDDSTFNNTKYIKDTTIMVMGYFEPSGGKYLRLNKITLKDKLPGRPIRRK